MPRNATEYDAIPMSPPTPDITFHIATGESIPFKVWQDRNSNTKLVKCDICGIFIPLSGAKQSIAALKKHRGKKTCLQIVKKSESTSTPFTFINNFPDVGSSSLYSHNDSQHTM
jgi:hypothetical protein